MLSDFHLQKVLMPSVFLMHCLSTYIYNVSRFISRSFSPNRYRFKCQRFALQPWGSARCHLGRTNDRSGAGW
jgi:hypothetical protein